MPVKKEIIGKSDLIGLVSEKIDGSKKEAKAYIEAIFEVVKEEVVNGKKVSIVDFGTFETATQKGRTGTIQFGDKKGETYSTEDKLVPKFKAGKGFKEAVL